MRTGSVAVREQPSAYQEGGTSNEPLLFSSLAAGDPRPTTLSEAQLSHLWAGQRLPASALSTRHGVPVRVLHPGRAGRGAGPDFRDAIISLPAGRVLRGDVELHVRASDFRVHGHERDPAYNRVVLHVVFEDDMRQDARLASGRRAPTVALAAWVERRARELASWLASPRLWREPCHDALARLGHEEVAALLRNLGDRRFEERTAAVADTVRTFGPDEALYRALLIALSYGGERIIFERVATQIPFRSLATDVDAAPAQERVRVTNEMLLHAAGEATRAAVGRPANRPERRLAGLAQLAVRHRRLFDEPALLDAPTPQGLIAAWSAPPNIGRSRAIELLVNAVLPWAAACAEARGDADAAERARQCFARLPRPARYGSLAFLEANVKDGEGGLPLDARSQQGLLALYKTECTQGGCGRCALS